MRSRTRRSASRSMRSTSATGAPRSASKGSPRPRRTSHAASSCASSVPWPQKSAAAEKRLSIRAISSPSVKQRAQRVEIDERKDLELGQRDVLVQLVDGRVDRAKLDHFRADIDDEAGVRRASGGRELAVRARMPLARFEHNIGEAAALAKERLRTEHPVDRVLERVLLENGFDALAKRLVAAFGGEAEIEVDIDSAGHHVSRAGAGMDVRDLEARRRKALVALVPLRAGELGQGRGDEMDRILHQMRVGDVALDAAHDEMT